MRARASSNSTLTSRLHWATPWRAILSALRPVAILREEEAQRQVSFFRENGRNEPAAHADQRVVLSLLRRIEHRAMLVALVQSVVSPFHEDFCPLDEGRGQETGEGTDQDFLEEGGVHPIFNSSDGASYEVVCSKRWRFSSQ